MNSVVHVLDESMMRGADESRSRNSPGNVRMVLKASDSGCGGHEMKGASLEQRMNW